MTDTLKTQVEMNDFKSDTNTVNEDHELAEALRNFVPGTAEEKKLVRKIDFYLMPMLWLMYILNYVDRTNIVSRLSAKQYPLVEKESSADMRIQGNAKIAGMQKDLGLTDDGYAWVLSIFFFGYLICEIPSNMILSRSRPSLFLPGIMLVWGVLSTLMSLSNNYAAMLAFRFVLGCIEAGFFPGVLYLLSCWYTSAELGKFHSPLLLSFLSWC